MTDSTALPLAAPPALATVDRPPTWLARAGFHHSSRFLSIGSSRLHFVEAGEGPPLLLLAGSPLWAFMYRGVIDALARDFHCIALDLPGLGLGHAPLDPGRTFQRNAELLDAFVAWRGLRHVTVVTHATWTPSAVDAVLTRPTTYAGLVVNNGFCWPLDDVPALRRVVSVVSSRAFGWLNVQLNLLPRVTARFGRRTRPFSPAERAAILEPYRSRHRRRHLSTLLSGLAAERGYFEDVESRLPQLRSLPTLLCYGELDNGYRAGFAERFRRSVPTAELDVLRGAAHFAAEDRPDGLADAVRSWWRRIA